MSRRWSDEDVERIRRSVVMLVPGHLCALDRESALDLIAQLQGARRRHHRLLQALDQIRALTAVDQNRSYPAKGSPPGPSPSSRPS